MVLEGYLDLLSVRKVMLPRSRSTLAYFAMQGVFLASGIDVRSWRSSLDQKMEFRFGRAEVMGRANVLAKMVRVDGSLQLLDRFNDFSHQLFLLR
jgi:hypothetical protein